MLSTPFGRERAVPGDSDRVADVAPGGGFVVRTEEGDTLPIQVLPTPETEQNAGREVKLHPVDAKLRPQTYRWPKRFACWILWKTWPVRWFWRPLAFVFRLKNPYRKVVLVARVLPGMPPPGQSKEIK